MTRVLDIALVVAIGGVVLIPLIVRVARRRFDPFEPIVLFAVAYGVMFIGRPAAMIASGEIVEPGPLRTLNVTETFEEMLLLALVGALAFVLGYEVSLGKKLANRSAKSARRYHWNRAIIAASVLAALAVLSFVLFLVLSGGVEALRLYFNGRSPGLREAAASLSWYFWFASFGLVPAALIVISAALRTRTRLAVGLALVISALVLVRAVPVGSRMLLLLFVGGVIALSYFRRRARPSLFAIVACFAVTLVLSAFLSDLRGREDRDESVAQTFARATKPSRLVAPFTSGPDTEMAPAFAAALALIPEELPHQYGGVVFGDLVVRWIPRVLWEAKPQPSRDRVSSRLWPTAFERGLINTEFSVLLYFYWDLGALGVAIGLGLIGIAARYFYEYLCKNMESAGTQVLGAMLMWFVVIALRNSLTDTFILAIFIVLPAWVVFRLAAVQSGDG